MASPEIRGTLDVGGTNVSTAWIAPRGSVATLVLAHGAGAGMDHPFMAGFSRAIAEAGVSTLRFNFPYVERGKRSPDPERVLRMEERLLPVWTRVVVANDRIAERLRAIARLAQDVVKRGYRALKLDPFGAASARRSRALTFQPSRYIAWRRKRVPVENPSLRSSPHISSSSAIVNSPSTCCHDLFA